MPKAVAAYAKPLLQRSGGSSVHVGSGTCSEVITSARDSKKDVRSDTRAADEH
jgi:hypothetical protein